MRNVNVGSVALNSIGNDNKSNYVSAIIKPEISGVNSINISAKLDIYIGMIEGNTLEDSPDDKLPGTQQKHTKATQIQNKSEVIKASKYIKKDDSQGKLMYHELLRS